MILEHNKNDNNWKNRNNKKATNDTHRTTMLIYEK